MESETVKVTYSDENSDTSPFPFAYALIPSKKGLEATANDPPESPIPRRGTGAKAGYSKCCLENSLPEPVFK